MKNYLFLFSFFLIGIMWGQNNIPKDYFINPVDIPLSLSGNFGELRNNHFHSGLDIRTQQRIGIEVKAAAYGYISRVKTDIFGYGNVLYIQHPNGYTTVYGHLEEFSPRIREYVRKRQYEQEKNVIELFPQKHELPVKQGEVIALSGESGGAGGPHLHYEIRDGLQRPMNPFLFGIKVADTKAPVVEALYAYPQNDESHIEGSSKKQELHLVKNGNNSYTTKTLEAGGELGFGVQTVDYMDNAPFTNGIYKIQTCLNGEPQMEIVFDKFSFANTRYINRYIDYEHFKNKKARIQKFFLETNNLIDMDIEAPQNGFIHIKDSADYKFEVILKDFAGNETFITIPLKGKKLSADQINQLEQKETNYFAHWNQENVFNTENHDIYIPKGALYENVYLDIEDMGPSKIKVHRFDVPLHKNMTVGFNVSHYRPEDIEKLYIASVTPWGRKYYSNTYKEEKRITTRTRIFGTFQLEKDSTPPSIQPLNFRDGKWVSDLSYLKLKIKDEESGISTYRGTLNGQFIVLEYDYKTDLIRYDFRDRVSNQTENHLKVIVTDKVGNSSVYEAVFYRKEKIE